MELPTLTSIEGAYWYFISLLVGLALVGAVYFVAVFAGLAPDLSQLF
jgi:hypothetical protein